jgi:hypothetical protein
MASTVEDNGGCSVTHCTHVRNYGGHCGVTGCPNNRNDCPVHGHG